LQGLFLHVVNMDYYGYLINPDGYDVSRTAPDLYELINNKLDWEQKYLHPEFVTKAINETYELEQVNKMPYTVRLSPRLELIIDMNRYRQ